MNQNIGYFSLRGEQFIKSSRTNRNHIQYLVITVLVLVIMLTVPGVAYTWTNETVDSNWDAGRYSSLALDSIGNPHISYMASYNAQYYYLKYAAKNGGLWTNETVESSEYFRDGVFSSLVLDNAGNPHISYIKSNGLMYAEWTGSAWNIQSPETVWGAGDDTSLAIDSTGHPHISYFDTTNHFLRYAKWNGNRWETQTVDNKGEMGMVTELDLDNADHPHISYYDAQNDWLKYALWNGSGWEIQIVTSIGYPLGLSMALDGEGYPHISYIDNTLKYAKWTGSEWTIQTVDSSITLDFADHATSLVLDSDGHPHISYYNQNNFNGDLKYAEWTGTTWEINVVDSEGDVGDSNSIALDTAGNPHISYYQGNTYDLKYAVGTPTPPSPSSITVTSPNGGETWQVGSEQVIQWSYTGDIGSTVKIELLKAGTLIQVLADSAPIGSDGSGSATLLAVPFETPGNDYAIRITSTTTPTITDTSDTTFTISVGTPTATITVTSPNGGEGFHYDWSYEIKWGYTGDPGQSVKIELLKGGVLDHVLTAATSINNGGAFVGWGNFYWMVPPTQPIGDDFSIRISSTTDPNINDTSNDTFSIYPFPGAKLLVPNGGEIWHIGNTYAITWNYYSPSNPDHVELYLLKGDQVVSTLTTTAPVGTNHYGSYCWTISQMVPSNDYKIRIFTISGGDRDDSDAPFTITDASSVPPVANFMLNTNTGTAPLVVTFTDQSTGSGITTWNWSFGDGTWENRTSSTNPVHSYAAGTWYPTLMVTNSSGSNTSLITPARTVTVAAAPGSTKVGVQLNNGWWLDANGNGRWDDGIDTYYSFGSAGVIPVTGDWNQDEITEIGVQLNDGWWLDSNSNGRWDDGIDTYYSFGSVNVRPVTGDWNKDNRTEIGVQLNDGWWLDSNGNGRWDDGIDTYYSFGSVNVRPVTGDWNQDGITEIGVQLNEGWWLDSNANGSWDDGVDTYYSFGSVNVRPVTGDWNQDGITEIGVQLNDGWWLDSNSNGRWDDGVDTYYSFGSANVRPVTGKWG